MNEFSAMKSWQVKDGRVIFPESDAGTSGNRDDDVLTMSGTVIENALGYARELETIV